MTTPTPPRTVADLAAVTGLHDDTVRLAIRAGQLPGYHVGRSYVVPADAFDAFCAGTWVPRPRPLFPEPIRPVNVSMLHRKQVAS